MALKKNANAWRYQPRQKRRRMKFRYWCSLPEAQCTECVIRLQVVYTGEAGNRFEDHATCVVLVGGMLG